MKLSVQLPRRNRSQLCRLVLGLSILYMITAFFSSTEVGERAEAVPDSAEEGVVEEVL
jgi:hypothetical protein